MRCVASWSSFLPVFFFFQAEDGIRDLTVTGVQTCALPIFTPNTPPRPVLPPSGRGVGGCVPSRWRRAMNKLRLGLDQLRVESFPKEEKKAGRSEERRVGKECRSRWSQYH